MHSTILIIDDSLDDLFLIKRYLHSHSGVLNILEASSGQEALDIIRSNPAIGYIFLDYMLPDMDGVDLLKEIYDSDIDLGPCPIIMMTGQGSEAVVVDAIRYGAQDYLMKNIISEDSLAIAMVKAREVYDLKYHHHESKAFLEHSQKMDAVGKLTGGIAHDFNNLLTIIFGNTDALQSILAKDSFNIAQCLAHVDKIHKVTERGAELVKRLMVFSRQRTLEPITTDVNKLIEELIDLLGRTLGNSIEIKTDLKAIAPNIDIDPGQLEHALINMGINARDVMLDGGVFSIKTTNVCLDDVRAQEFKISPGDYVCVSVGDTGSGISDDVIANIFDPFFTTKAVGKGTGLGLSMVYGFIKDSGGNIEVLSEANQGTCFHLYLPCSEASCVADVQDHVQDDLSDRKGQHTILVVEDEEDIRSLTVTLLIDKGYNILEARTGDEALEIVQNTDQHIDLIFTDIMMPGDLNGVQMAARVEVIRPDIKFLFTTGYAADAAVDINLIKDYPSLQKPYKLDGLMRKLSDVFENQGIL